MSGTTELTVKLLVTSFHEANSILDAITRITLGANRYDYAVVKALVDGLEEHASLEDAQIRRLDA